VRSTTVRGTINPRFKESLFVALPDKYGSTSIPLQVHVFDWDIVGKDEYEGGVTVELDLKTLKQRDAVPYTVDLEPHGGKVTFTVEYKANIKLSASYDMMEWNKIEQRDTVYALMTETLELNIKESTFKHTKDVNCKDGMLVQPLIYSGSWKQTEIKAEGVMLQLVIDWSQCDHMSGEDEDTYQVLVHGGLKNAEKITFIGGASFMDFRVPLVKQGE
jgi:hypothetical protein